jgi:UDP-sugar pyrophosphorylase
MQELLKMLIEEGQGHVVAFWSVAGVNDDAKRRLVQQLCKLSAAYPGGLQAYLRNARELLEASRRGDNPFQGMRPSVPIGVTLSVMSGTGRIEEYEAKGLEAAKHTAFVLVAGGLGERLGYHGIKVLIQAWLLQVCVDMRWQFHACDSQAVSNLWPA